MALSSASASMQQATFPILSSTDSNVLTVIKLPKELQANGIAFNAESKKARLQAPYAVWKLDLGLKYNSEAYEMLVTVVSQ